MGKDNDQNNDYMDKDYWKGKQFSFINHKDCEFFPCHKTEDPDNFNCLFCYCPLYALKDKCGGNFKYTPEGIKDCSQCMVPHKRNNYPYIMGKFSEILELTRMTPEELEKKEK